MSLAREQLGLERRRSTRVGAASMRCATEATIANFIDGPLCPPRLSPRCCFTWIRAKTAAMRSWP